MIKKITLKKIRQKYSPQNKNRKDSPTSFYTWTETQIMLKSSCYSPNTLATDYQLITQPQEVESALQPLQNVSILGIDCETTGIDPITSKVRLVQLAIPNHPVIILDLFALPSTSLAPLKALLSSNCLKVAHNLKFEWQMLHGVGVTLTRPYYDTYLAYRVLTAGLKKTLSLKAVAAKLLNIKLDKTEQKSNFSKDLTSSQLQYAATDAAILLPLHKILSKRLKQANLTKTAQLEFATIPSVAKMELNGIHLDLAQWQKRGLEMQQRKSQLIGEIDQQLKLPSPQQISLLPSCTTTINPNSPKQLIEAFEAKGIKIKSTNTQTLVPLAQQQPVVKQILEYRSLSNRISTFAEGLPKYIHPVTERIHGNWFQIGAKSGRFSCRKPNLTNIPRDKATRSCFTAAPGCMLIKADYSQIELRIMAKVSGDRRMGLAYQKGKDLHRLTASLVFNQPLTQVTDEQRRLGKIINFGLIYGMGVEKFVTTTAKDHNIILSQNQASHFRRKYFQAYTGVRDYHNQVRKQWQNQSRESRTLFGRRRLWSKADKPTLNEMINHPIQGTNADIIKLALAKLFKPLNLTSAKLIAVIHDEILIECAIADVERVAQLLKSCMIKAAARILDPIPVVVDIETGYSWGG